MFGKLGAGRSTGSPARQGPRIPTGPLGEWRRQLLGTHDLGRQGTWAKVSGGSSEKGHHAPPTLSKNPLWEHLPTSHLTPGPRPEVPP